jgi:hypothetical protein
MKLTLFLAFHCCCIPLRTVIPSEAMDLEFACDGILVRRQEPRSLASLPIFSNGLNQELWFLLAWIVIRINIVDFQRGPAVNLQNRFSTAHGVVMHAGIKVGKAGS